MFKDKNAPTGAAGPYDGARRRAARRWVTGIIVVVAVGAAGLVLGARALRADAVPSLAVAPASYAQVYTRPTPFSITIQAASLTGAGQTPVAGYQYAIQWNPAILQWLSGPDVPAPTPTPQSVLPCTQVVQPLATSTPLPPGVLPTDTPTSTSTPGLTTPTNTATNTVTATATATPSGYILVACATLPGTPGTVLASGTVGTFRFRPLVIAPVGSPLNLLDVKFVDAYGTELPGASGSGYVNLVVCYDFDGDGMDTIADIGLVAGHYRQKAGDPGWDPVYDVDGDGAITISDLGRIALAYRLKC